MQRCHACRRELSQDDLAEGVCPGCGAALPLIAKRRLADKTTPPAEEEQPKPSDIGRTVDFSASDTHETGPVGLAGKEQRMTLQDQGDKTVEFDAPVGGSSGDAGADDFDIQATQNLVPPTSKETHTDQGAFTIDFGGDDPDLSAHMTTEWGAALKPDSQQGQTLRQSGTINEFISKNTRSSLPVKNRSVRQRTDEGEMTPLVPGDVPDYELLEMIGQGGMGVVYAAHQSSIARTVAIKMLKPGMKVGEEARDKFISEAVVTGELDHPNIVPIYDLGANEEGALFYSMKRVKGTPWDEVLTDKSLGENLNILMRVADAVAFAHAGGVVHRDLKPENVMLGDYGEVLVMDWGLARVTASFRNADAIYQSDTLGGTPAYMAPEMARGPIENIDLRSDIYLLGAMLYEIVSGRAPHSGRDVMQCLMAAASNKIDPIDQNGELVDIAMRAMATKPADRYDSVKDMQAAIRRYQSHSESLVLTDNAAQHLEQAQQQSDYKLYARALYGCQEALTLWEENSKAGVLLEETQLAYAGAALKNEDFDLGVSLLSGDTPAQQKLLSDLEKGKQERDARLRRLTLFKRVAAAAVAAFILGGTYFTYEIRKQRNVAVVQRKEAVRQEGIAKSNEKKAVAAKKLAEKRRKEADKARSAEAVQRREADRQRDLADKNAKEATEQRDEAKRQEAEAKRQEAEAKRQEQIANNAKIAEEYEAYVARIGLAAAKIDENAFDSARAILAACEPGLRNWEWGRLNYLCGLSPKAFDHAGPVEAVAYSPDGRFIATGDWDGRVIVRDGTSGKQAIAIKLAQYVHAVAYSPDGATIAAGCSDGAVRLINASSGEITKKLVGHKEGVLTVAFSPTGGKLLSGGYDSTARLWDLTTGKPEQQLRGHGWWVWTARFSPDGARIVTASQDGKAIVWQRDAKTNRYAEFTHFDRHDGPVYTAVFSPNGQTIASAGYDNQVCLWRPDDIQTTGVASQVDGDQQTQPQHVTLEGHRGPVRSVAFSADGQRLLSASYDNSLRLWDVASGQSIKTLRGHGSGVRACVFAPNGRWAASGGQDQKVRLWDIAGYEESRVLRGRVLADHQDAVLSARFSADGRQVITASRDRSSKLWNAADGKLLRTFEEGHEFLASSAVFFADGRRLATGAGDNSVRVWDVAAGVETLALRPTGRAGALAVAPDGAWIATGGPSGEARVWPVQQGAQPTILAGHEEEVTAAAINAAGDLLATGDDRGVIRLWRQEAGKWTAGHVMKGHSRTITGLKFASADWLISSSGDNTCGQWNVATGKEDRSRVLKHGEWVGSLDVSADGRFAITAADDGRARVWRLADAQELARHESPGGVYTSVSFSADGLHALLASSSDRKVSTWDWSKANAKPITVVDAQRGGLLWAARFAGSTKRILTVGGNDAQLWAARSNRPTVRFSPHGAVASADLSPDGRLAATGSWDNSIKLWDTATGDAVRKLDGAHGGYVNSVAFSPDGRTLLSSSDDGTAILWPLKQPSDKRTTLRGHTGRVLQASYSADGARVLTVGSDKTARLWDANTGRELRQFQGHQWAVLCGAISSDGTRIVTGSEDNTAIVWDSQTGKPLRTLAGHTASITSVAFSADGTRVLTGGRDRAAKLWDARTGKEILTLDGHTREVTSVAFSPSGRHALTASRDGAAILWLAQPWQAPRPLAAAGN